MPSDFPGLHRFNEVCRRANRGDENAKAQLKRWVDAMPGMLDGVTDIIAVARGQLIDFLAGDSAETKALLDLRIDDRSSELADDAGGDPLSRLCADVVLLVYMDLLRCTTAAIRPVDTTKSARYWESAADRSERRWVRVEKAFAQHRKRTAGRGRRGQSE